MKRILLSALAAAATIIAGCTKSPDAPVPETATFIDVNVTFGHPKIKAEPGMTLHGWLFRKDVTSVETSSLKPDMEKSLTLTDNHITDGCRLTFEPVDRSWSMIQILVWLDNNGSGTLDENDLAMFSNATVESVASGESTPVNCSELYALDLRLTKAYGEKEFVVPEGKAADADLNLYTEVVIGPHIWLKESLRTTKYQDGREILQADGDAFASANTAACVNPHATAEELETFGLLYNWFTVKEGNPCPEGYRIPSDADFIALERFVAPLATDLGTDKDDAPEKNVTRATEYRLGTLLKSPDYGFAGTDEYGFCGLPGGIYGTSFDQGAGASTMTLAIWTSDEFNSAKGIRRLLRAGWEGVGRGADTKAKGHSLRCVKDNPDYVPKQDLPSPELSVEGTMVKWSAVPEASGYSISIDGIAVQEPVLTEKDGIISFDVLSVKEVKTQDITYTVTVIANGDAERWNPSAPASVQVIVTGQGEEPVVTYVEDVDGNKYETVTIGTQTWMRDHLRTTKFSDGTEIPSLSGDDFAKATSAAYVNPYQTAAETEKYGLLYNWYSVATTGKNLCPEGWHVPSDAEFKILESCIAPEATDIDAENGTKNVFRGVAQGLGKMMKSNADGFGGTADSEFRAYAGGTYSNALSKDASASTKICVLWVTDEYDGTYAYRRMLQHNNDGSGRGAAKKTAGQSVRCVKD
ncbi:MAG: FISUMP domain-containing protein [Candidatus Cryptobacteroides sp.]